jgi:hypothetical protein
VLAWSAGLMLAAAAMGVGLLVISQIVSGPTRLRWPGLLHGALGIAAFAALLAGLGGPARGVASGASGFGVIAAIFVGVAVLLGLLLFSARMRRRPPSMLVVGLHASVAVGGLVMLAAYVST